MSFFSRYFKKRSENSDIETQYYLFDQIIGNFVNDVGIDLTRLGPIEYNKKIPVHLKSGLITDKQTFQREIAEVSPIVDSNLSDSLTSIFWFKIKCVDQAINEYVGPNYFKSNDWIQDLIDLLSLDKADQSGDTIVVIFKTDWEWALSFELSQDDSTLLIEKFASKTAPNIGLPPA